MRIACIVSEFPKLSETFILSQITGLIDRGHEVDIYAKRPNDARKVHADVAKYRLMERTYYYDVLYTLPRNKLRRLTRVARCALRRGAMFPRAFLHGLDVRKHGRDALSMKEMYKALPFLENGPYDIIMCHYGLRGKLGVYLKQIGATKAKVITMVHGYDVSSYVRRHGPDVYRTLFAHGDLFLHASGYMRDRLVNLGCDPSRTRLLRCGVSIERFTFTPRTPAPDGLIRLVTVGRLTEKKGLEFSIRAVAKLVPQYPGLRYRIAGDGELRESLQRLIDELGVGEQITLLGWQSEDEVRRLCDESQMFVLASVTASDGDVEGLGVALLEAQAMGLPVIATRHNGFPETIRDGESGYLVPERDVDKLAEAIRFVIEHPEQWPAIGRAGREHVETHFDNQALNDRLVELYHQALEGADRTHDESIARAAICDGDRSGV